MASRLGKLTAAAFVFASAAIAAPALDYDFFKARVEPIFLQKRPGHTRCVVCHAERSNNAFRLEKLPAGGRWTEEQSGGKPRISTLRHAPGGRKALGGNLHKHRGDPTGALWPGPDEGQDLCPR